MMPPHFYGVIDKGTVDRRTSQAACLIFQNNERRCAHPLGALLVYKRATDSDEDGLPDVDGGSAGDLARNLIWDAPHLLNLPSTDIKEGKCGNSKTFFNKFIKRGNEFNHLLSRGKGYAILKLVPKERRRMQLLSLRLPHSIFSVQLLINGKLLRKDFQCCTVLYCSFRGRRGLSPQVQSFWSRFCIRPSWLFGHNCSTVRVDDLISSY